LERAEIEQRVRGILADVLGLAPGEVDEHTSPDTVKAWDSLQHLTIVLSLEEEFEIAFDEEETLTVVTFPLIVDAVAEHLGIAELS
jgi:acyl carrier protein